MRIAVVSLTDRPVRTCRAPMKRPGGPRPHEINRAIGHVAMIARARAAFSHFGVVSGPLWTLPCTLWAVDLVDKAWTGSMDRTCHLSPALGRGARSPRRRAHGSWVSFQYIVLQRGH